MLFRSEDIIEEYDKYWQTIIGTRGATGKKTVNANTMFANLFDLDDQNSLQSEHDEEFSEEEQLILDQLESQVKK